MFCVLVNTISFQGFGAQITTTPTISGSKTTPRSPRTHTSFKTIRLLARCGLAHPET